MRRSGPPIVVLLLVAATAACGTDRGGDDDDIGGEGEGEGEGEPGCNVEVAAGFPMLGDGCGAHLIYRWTTQTADSEYESITERGARPVGSGFYDLRFDDETLYLSSIEPGTYEDGSGAEFIYYLLLLYDSLPPGHITVEIAGNDGEYVWGTLDATACSQESEYCALADGTFAARIDPERRDLPDADATFPCSEPSDCPDPGCGPVWCESGLCWIRGDLMECPDGQYCDVGSGCTG